MPCRLVAVSFDVREPHDVASFWAGMLGRDPVPEEGGVLLPGDETQVGLRFVASDRAASTPALLHLHLTSTSPEDQRRQVDRALERGGRRPDWPQDPDDPHVVLVDPGGGEFCVIEPGNNYLAGCGRLGEVTCEGSRAVGFFWRDALSWPLVWDEGEQTAVQSPRGGTKISWDGADMRSRQGRNHQRVDLATADVPAEVQRLVALGATRLPDVDGTVELADPDGNAFRLTGS